MHSNAHQTLLLRREVWKPGQSKASTAVPLASGEMAYNSMRFSTVRHTVIFGFFFFFFLRRIRYRKRTNILFQTTARRLVSTQCLPPGLDYPTPILLPLSVLLVYTGLVPFYGKCREEQHLIHCSRVSLRAPWRARNKSSLLPLCYKMQQLAMETTSAAIDMMGL